ncbi:hypothetical protein BZG36_02511 [Bifiguratus adelaidae]|uniref:Uncharacterized protein n=1 Tax=Bifiguratus adelaidae TaxID=1938954 RepID=A0A261Y2V6_9FUNG|nr:hypothetical protein BZG36_02511 [Bifiguratus adelaidae]
MVCRWIVLLAIIAVACAQTNSSNGSVYRYLNSQGYDQYLYRDANVAAQVLLSNNNASTVNRFVAAFPAGNSGAMTYFEPLVNGSTPLAVRMVNNSISGVGPIAVGGGRPDAVGVQGTMTFSQSARINVEVLGSVRALRDYVEGPQIIYPQMAANVSLQNSSVTLHRIFFNQTFFMNLTLTALDSSTTFGIDQTNGNVTINLANGTSSANVNFTVILNEPELHALSVSEDFINGTAVDTSDPAATDFSFLTYHEKFLAGGWRFLTYFGRDTLITLRLMMDQLSQTAIESVFSAALERINATAGYVCHEETIGDYASWQHIQMNESYLGDSLICSYIMLDTDYLLLPALAHYFLDLPSGANQSSQLLSRQATMQNGTYMDLLLDNVHRVMDSAAPFANNPTASNLVQIRDPNVGDWRDSNIGLAGGKYPFDVNAALIPAAVRAIARLAEAGIFNGTSSTSGSLSKRGGHHQDHKQHNGHGHGHGHSSWSATSTTTAIPTPSGGGSGNGGNGTSWLDNLATNASQIASVWEQNSLHFFECNISSQDAAAQLANYTSFANLTAVSPSNITDFSNNSALNFYAVSLAQDGTPICVMNTDESFLLTYRDDPLPASFLNTTANLITSRFPAGLSTDVGLVVANPAFSGNDTLWSLMDRTAYHGTVVWSFQQSMMAYGLAKQLGNSPDSTSTNSTTNSTTLDPTVVSPLKDAQKALWNIINSQPSVKYTEVWSWTYNNASDSYSVTDLGSLSPTGTESDAVQLWSLTLLSVKPPVGL